MTITINRDSVCAADDVFDHRQTFELSENATIKDLLRQLKRALIWIGQSVQRCRDECVSSAAQSVRDSQLSFGLTCGMIMCGKREKRRITE